MPPIAARLKIECDGIALAPLLFVVWEGRPSGRVDVMDSAMIKLEDEVLFMVWEGPGGSVNVMVDSTIVKFKGEVSLTVVDLQWVKSLLFVEAMFLGMVSEV